MSDEDFAFVVPVRDWTDPSLIEELFKSIESGLVDAEELQGHVLAAHNQGACAGYAAAQEVLREHA